MESTDEEKLLNALVMGEDTATLIAQSLASARTFLVSHYVDREEQAQELLNQAQAYKAQLDTFFAEIGNNLRERLKTYISRRSPS